MTALTQDVPNVWRTAVDSTCTDISPMYFNVVVGTSTAQAGLILSVCGGLGLAMGSMAAGHHIRKGGKYRWLGVASLVPAVFASFLACAWTPNWPWWGYYLTFFPASLGYSVFLCVQLGKRQS